MKTIKNLLGGSLLALTVLAQQVPAAEAVKPIHFGDITWESGSLITDTLPGSTV